MYVDSFIHGPHLPSWAGLTRRVLDSVYEESNYFTTSDPVNVCKNHLHYEVVKSFLEAHSRREVAFTITWCAYWQA
jgi:hypothetical protein